MTTSTPKTWPGPTSSPSKAAERPPKRYNIRTGVETSVNEFYELLREIYGKDPLIVRSGGTVPITEVFKRELGVDTVTIGFGLPGSRAHAPNEWFRVVDFDVARRTYAAFFDAMAKAGSECTNEPGFTFP